MMSPDDLITPALVYLSIGGVLWLVLGGLGIVDNTFAARSQMTAVRIRMVLATLAMIAGWPAFVFRYLKGMWST
jgi:hypothetical protein